MDGVEVSTHKPVSPCRLRLEKRKWRNDEANTEPEVFVKMANAERLRSEIQDQRMEKLHARLTYVASVVNSQAEKAEKLASKMEARLERAAEARSELLATRASRSKSQVSKVKSGQINEEKARMQLLRLQQRLYRAEKIRERQITSIQQRLASKLQLVQEKHSQIVSVRKIQSWARSQMVITQELRRVRTIQTELASVLAGADKIATSSFEVSADLLRSPELLNAAVKVCSFKASNTSPAAKQKAKARTFLTANLITSHPEHIFEHPEDDDCVLLSRVASTMIKALQEIPSKLTSRRETAIAARKFDALLSLYMQRFEDWKKADAEKLAATMLEGYRQVFASYLETMYRVENSSADSARDGRREVGEGTEQQLLQFEQALMRILGKTEAKRRVAVIREAVKTELEQLLKASEQKTSAGSVSPILSSSPPRVVLPERQQSPTRQQKEAEPKSPQQADMVFTRTVMENEQLAHELIIDPNYQLKSDFETVEDGLASRIQSMMKKAFWDHLKADLKAGGYARLPSLFVDLRNKLSNALSNNKVAVSHVYDIFADSLIESLVTLSGSAEKRVLGAMCNDTLNCILRWEAPARQTSTRQWLEKLRAITRKTPDDSVLADILPSFFEFCFSKVEEMQLDMMNFNLKLLGPYLRQHGVDYERRKFEEKLGAGQLSLERTTECIRKEIVQQVAEEGDAFLAMLKQKDSGAYARIIKGAMISMLRDASQSNFTLPETFRMDGVRLREMRDQLDMIVLEASMVAILHQTLAKPHLKVVMSPTTVESFVRNLDVLLHDSTIKIPDLASEVIETVRKEANKYEKEITAEEAEAITKQITGLLDASNPVFHLISKRTRAVLMQYLLSGVLPEALVKQNRLEMFTSALSGLGAKIAHLSKHNQDVYASFYNSIISDVAEGL